MEQELYALSPKGLFVPGDFHFLNLMFSGLVESSNVDMITIDSPLPDFG